MSSLAEAKARSAERQKLANVLREHWLTGIICDHEAKTDTPTCACSLWKADPQPSIQAAVDAWVFHVLDVRKSELTDVLIDIARSGSARVERF